VLILIYKKGKAIAIAIVRASQLHELLIILNKVSYNLVNVLIILKRKSLKGINALCPLEFWNFELD